MKQLFVLLIIILNIGIVHLSAQPMKELEQLVSITFFEKTNNTFEHMYDIEDVRLNERLDGNLNSSNFDFQGTPNREFYDVYYSDGDGNFKATGEFITVSCEFNQQTGGGGLNLVEVQLNFENNFSVFLNHLESYFGNGSNFAEPSVGFGNDCDLETWTTMGNTAESDQRLRTTLGTIDSYSIETYNGCAGDPYQIGFNGNIYNEANPIGTEILQNQAGCDSLVHVNLNFVNEATNSNFSYEGCIDEGFSIIINEVVYNQENPSGEEIFTRNGLCDSIVKVDLIFMDCSDPDDGCDIYIPNIISPNDDGFNDQFMIFPNSTNFEVLKILIFDRYGNLLFKSNNTSVILWDATFNNDKVAPGVYTYIIESRCFNQSKKKHVGNITVIY